MSELRQPRGSGAEVGHTGVGVGCMHPPRQGPTPVIPMPAKKENRPKKRPTTSAGNRGVHCLSTKQLLFIEEYLVDFVGSAAAMRAGYSEKSAAQTAYKMLRNAHALDRIMHRLRKRMKDAEERGDNEWRRMADIAFSQLTDLVSWDGEGEVTIKPREELIAKGRAAAKEIAVYRTPKGGTSTVIKARDPLPALKLLAERREKEKTAEAADEKGPKHFGTIFYFDRGAKVEPRTTAANDGDDGSRAD